MADIGGLAESGARYTEMPHVIEITLPMLCSYLPRWWERGPEAPPPALPAGAPPPCTAVTSDHLNSLLGNILRIIVNNLGIDEATWMKRLAGGSGERAGPENWGQCPGTRVSGSQREISGSVLFWEWGGVRSRFSRDHKARDHSQEPESQGHSVRDGCMDPGNLPGWIWNFWSLGKG